MYLDIEIDESSIWTSSIVSKPPFKALGFQESDAKIFVASNDANETKNGKEENEDDKDN